MVYAATVTSKGQVTIPQRVREDLRINKGDAVYFDIKSKKDKVVTMKAVSVQETIDRLYGALGGDDVKYVPYRKVREMAGKMLGEKYKVK